MTILTFCTSCKNKNENLPVTNETIFTIGSLAKQIAAVVQLSPCFELQFNDSTKIIAFGWQIKNGQKPNRWQPY